MSLEGRVALVTGGGRGIGRGIATVLAAKGAAVVIGDLDEANAAATANDIAASGGKALGFALDVTQAAQAEAAIQRAVQEFGRLDILVNNAGMLQGKGGREVTPEQWQQTLSVNLVAVWTMCRAAVPVFQAQGGGKIVNIASIAGRHGGPVHPHYSASKAAVINLTQSLAMELGRYSINVNAVCPGLVHTQMWETLESMVASMRSRPADVGFIAPFIAERMPLRREQTPEDIGYAVAFFASDEARNITGQSLNVDGGIEMN